MELNVKTIEASEKEYIEIGCHKVDDRVREIVHFVKSRQGSVEGSRGDQIFRLSLVDIYYIESVDDKTFIYMQNDCYESKKRLYEFENVLTGRRFARISKSVIVNMMKVTAIRPALNGRFLCQLDNGENVIISRKYVPEIKEKLRS